MGFLTAAVFLLEVRGYSKLYDNVEDSKYGYPSFSNFNLSVIINHQLQVLGFLHCIPWGRGSVILIVFCCGI